MLPLIGFISVRLYVKCGSTEALQFPIACVFVPFAIRQGIHTLWQDYLLFFRLVVSFCASSSMGC
jgi:hypothetical protein